MALRAAFLAVTGACCSPGSPSTEAAKACPRALSYAVPPCAIMAPTDGKRLSLANERNPERRPDPDALLALAERKARPAAGVPRRRARRRQDLRHAAARAAAAPGGRRRRHRPGRNPCAGRDRGADARPRDPAAPAGALAGPRRSRSSISTAPCAAGPS